MGLQSSASYVRPRVSGSLARLHHAYGAVECNFRRSFTTESAAKVAYVIDRHTTFGATVPPLTSVVRATFAKRSANLPTSGEPSAAPEIFHDDLTTYWVAADDLLPTEAADLVHHAGGCFTDYVTVELVTGYVAKEKGEDRFYRDDGSDDRFWEVDGQ